MSNKFTFNKKDISAAAILLITILSVTNTSLNETALHSVLGLTRYLIFGWSIFLYISSYKRFRLSTHLLLIFVLSVCLSTVLYSGRINPDCWHYFRIGISSIIITSFYLRTRPKATITTFSITFTVYMLVNAYMFVGQHKTFFSGVGTGVTYYLLPAIAFNYLFVYYFSYSKRLKRFGVLLFVAAIGSSFYFLTARSQSITLVCTLLAIVGVFIINKRVAYVIYDFGFIVTSILNLIFVFMGSFGVFSYILTNVLGESLTFNGRSEIWQLVLLNIYKRPLLGYGFQSGVYFNVWSNTIMNNGTHNYFLQLLFYGGVLLLVIYFLYILHIHIKYKEINKNKLIRYFFVILVIMNIEGIGEHYGLNAITMLFLTVLGNLELVCQGE